MQRFYVSCFQGATELVGKLLCVFLRLWRKYFWKAADVSWNYREALLWESGSHANCLWRDTVTVRKELALVAHLSKWSHSAALLYCSFCYSIIIHSFSISLLTITFFSNSVSFPFHIISTSFSAHTCTPFPAFLMFLSHHLVRIAF